MAAISKLISFASTLFRNGGWHCFAADYSPLLAHSTQLFYLFSSVAHGANDNKHFIVF